MPSVIKIWNSERMRMAGWGSAGQEGRLGRLGCAGSITELTYLSHTLLNLHLLPKKSTKKKLVLKFWAQFDGRISIFTRILVKNVFLVIRNFCLKIYILVCKSNNMKLFVVWSNLDLFQVHNNTDNFAIWIFTSWIS